MQIAATNIISSTAGLCLKFKNQMVPITKEQLYNCMLQRYDIHFETLKEPFFAA